MTSDMKNLIRLARELDPESFFTEYVSADGDPVPRDVNVFHRHNYSIHRQVNSHGRYILIYCLTGNLVVNVDGYDFPLTPNDCLVIFPFQGHFYHDIADSYDLFCLGFVTDWKGYAPLRGRCMQMPDLGDHLAEIASVWAQPLANRDGTGLVIHLLSILQRMLSQISNLGVRQRQPEVPSKLNGRILRFIYDSVRRRLTIGELARHFNYSESHLKRLFKEWNGIPLGQFIQQTKLNAACEMLAGTDRRVGEIAYALGYESVPSFSLAFKKHTGKSPRAYRERENSGTFRATR